MALKKHAEFPAIDQILWLTDGHLQPNEYIGTDMPSDMNPTMEESFIARSIERNIRFQDNPKHICGIQYKWLDFADFQYRMHELEPVYINKKKIVGLGNLCRLLINRKTMTHNSDEYKYFRKIIDYLILNKKKFYWVHIYGMSLYAIKQFVPLLEIYAPNIHISVDSTKWTRPATNRLKLKYMKAKDQSQLFPTPHKQSGLCCTKITRDEFFLENIKEIQKAGVTVQW
jgi:hypothetical protein